MAMTRSTSYYVSMTICIDDAALAERDPEALGGGDPEQWFDSDLYEAAKLGIVQTLNESIHVVKDSE